MYLLSNPADSLIILHQYILTLNNSAKYHNIDVKLYPIVRHLPPILNVQFTKTDWLYSWWTVVRSVNKHGKSVPGSFIDYDIHGFIWTEIDLLCKCYCNHRTHITFSVLRSIRKYNQYNYPICPCPRILHVSHMMGCWIYSPQNEIMHDDRVINGGCV
jgi:hypothetical protein